MSQLDRHVATVQTKLALRRFLDALAWSTLIFAALMILGVLVQKFFHILPDNFPVKWILIGGLCVCAVVALTWALIKKPTREQAATAIDERLRLKEKFSTAIYVRPSSDPFAMAAVRDAETTATNVQLGKQFPISFPKPGYVSAMLGVVAFCLAWFLPAMDLFGQKNLAPKAPDIAAAQPAAKEAIARAIAAVESMPKNTQTTDEFRRMVAELKDLQKASKIDDPARANRRALQALQEVNNQTYKGWDKAKKYAEAQNSLMQSLQPPDDAKGPVGEARKEIAKGNFDEASNKLEEAIKNFDKMSEKDKEDAAKQMQQAAQQLQQLANNQQLQQQIQQQLQQMGANQQQAQQMQQLMQQAAQGGQQGQQAAQQLQQMAQQMAQQMNNGQGPNQQQQQQMQQAMQQMQAQANAQNQANALGQAAQQMAQAMQQGQQANGQQNPQQGQQMQQAQQQMKQALQNMQGVKQDLQQMAQQMQQNQQAMQQAQQCANGQCQGGAQGQQQAGNGQKQGQGQFNQGNPQNKGNGMGQAGIGQGGVASKDLSPYGVKMEQSPSQDDEKGRILASYLVKDKADPGAQKMAIQELAKKAEKEATDEVDPEHANRAAQKVAQEYFRTMERDGTVAPKK